MAESADGRSASNSAAENRFADATEEDAEADPVFQVRGTQIKKLRRAEGGAKIFGVFRMKNHDFTPKNHIFSNFRGGARRVRSPLDPPLRCVNYILILLLIFK